MGREWYLNWGTKSSSKKAKTNGGGGRGGGRRGSERGGGEKKASTPPTAAAAAAAAASAGGCMNAVLHLFDFQHFQLCLHPQDSSFFPDDPTPPKGVEAPRNSLESITEEDKDDHLCNAKDRIQIKTNRKDTALKLVQAPRGKVEDVSSESSCSPAGARTPNVVARLMGLEILPESNTSTPRSSHSQISPHIRTSSTTPITTKSSSKKTVISSNHSNASGARSSPETPRSSTTSTRRRSMDVVDSPTKSSRRRSTDVVDHHRLSLQINKENSIQKEMELSRPSCSAISTKRRDGKNCHEEEVTKSPSYYARQIMKQVRETVSRRVGVDITNTIGAERREHRRDEHLLSSSTTTILKPKKSSKKDRQLSPLSSSSSPKLKSYSDENNNRTITMCSKSDQYTPPAVAEVLSNTVTAVQAKSLGSENNERLTRLTTIGNSSSKSSLISKKQLKSCDPIKSKKDEQFVRPSTTTTSKKLCKKTILSSDSVPSLVPFKKDYSPPTKSLDNQGVPSNAQPSKPIITNTGSMTTTSTKMTRLSRYPRQRINGQILEEATHAPTDRWMIRRDARTAVTTAMEFQYISKILKCTGIDRDTPVSFMRWYLPSHPLDPSIFHNLEATHYHTTSNNSPCENFNLTINRKLIFHLVDEMLVDILKPHVKLKHHYHLRHHHRHNQWDEQNQQINGFQLVKILCSKIRSFPSSDCQTLQDIDALVEKDLPGFGAASNLIAYLEEGENIVLEIERDIMDSLVQEIICYN